MTRKLDLRTGRPVWQAYRAPTVAAEPLLRDVSTDVLVVGMGISGAMMAETLTGQGHSVVMIDRRGPMKGSTPATTALVQFEIDQPMTLLSGKIGLARTQAAWRRSRLAVANLRARIDELGIGCNLAASPSLYLAGNLLGAGALRAEAEARRLAGIHATYLTAGDLKQRFGIDRDGAILSHDNLSLDPRKLTARLLRKASERKARFHAPVEATTFRHDRETVTVETGHGALITAKWVVLATGYELTDIVPAENHQVISTWAIATARQKNSAWKTLPFFWEASDPYLYLRTTHDGRIVCGGEDEEFSDEEARDALIADKTRRIAGKLKKLLPWAEATPEFTWTGSFGTTATGLPIIGKVPRHPRIFALMGYGGNGITYSQIASEVISAAIAGEQDADAGLYAL